MPDQQGASGDPAGCTQHPVANGFCVHCLPDPPVQPDGCCQEHCTVGHDGMYGDQHCDEHCSAGNAQSPERDA